MIDYLSIHLNILPICLLKDIALIITNKSIYKDLTVEIEEEKIRVYSTNLEVDQADQHSIDEVNEMLLNKEFIIGKKKILELVRGYPQNYNLLNNARNIKSFEYNKFAEK
jgi:hypothetical protein